MKKEKINKLRRAFYDQFLSLNWIPSPLTSRVWTYEPDSSYSYLPTGLPPRTKAPRIFVLNKAEPSWLNNEEEESDGIGRRSPEESLQGIHGEYETRKMDLYVSLREEEEENTDEEMRSV
jgi:hypothetical protein